ncbi:MAG: beta-galactosidase [Bacteroides sp.]|nr:beta-galactosidase [Bacteroides sp.]
MKKVILVAAMAAVLGTSAQAQWHPAGDKLKTRWASQVTPENALPEYPRLIMERGERKNLNGLWEYAIVDRGTVPASYEGQILVSFAVESSLSGVGRTCGPDKELWYQRTFSVPAAWRGKRVMLNFGAVDWKADVWVNDVKVGEHTGGYTPFSLDITPALADKGNNKLVVKVWDPTDRGPQPRGKQVNRPEGIWHTAVSGIWQTVWMEPVADNHITNIRTTPDIDHHRLTVDVATAASCQPQGVVEVKVFDGKQLVATGKGLSGQSVDVLMPADAKLWSPASPFLYTLEVVLKESGRVTDKVDSYTAMRKYSTRRDADGIVRLQLNNKDVFQFGPLDQGWWPDGLYTAPTDEALAYDIQKTKDFGFNMIRKHVKVEPARWYTHCDQLGIIVWQDMPSGDREPEWQMYNYFTGSELNRSEESEYNYRKEWKEIMDCLYNYPCIGVWVPFNERWGQFKTEEITAWTKKHDPSRLVNPASGGNHFPCGDILDLHHYPNPSLDFYDAGRATVLGEYGGIGMAVQGHLWEPNRNWGYVKFNSPEEVTRQYVDYAHELLRLIPRGFSAAVYTQTTDVEMEVNGFMTYDREVVKMDEAKVKAVNTQICNSLKK